MSSVVAVDSLKSMGGGRYLSAEDKASSSV